jgi:hypothetical protein
MFIFGGFILCREDIVSFYLSDNGQTVNQVSGILRTDAAGLRNDFRLIQLLLGVTLFRHDTSASFPVLSLFCALLFRQHYSGVFLQEYT